MTFSELKNTHKEITGDVATVGIKGYTIDDNIVKIWNGDHWEDGVYVVDGDELIHKSTFAAFGLTE